MHIVMPQPCPIRPAKGSARACRGGTCDTAAARNRGYVYHRALFYRDFKLRDCHCTDQRDRLDLQTFNAAQGFLVPL